jgi:16S rRNA (cytosine967-C5)-methyltransferase
VGRVTEDARLAQSVQRALQDALGRALQAGTPVDTMLRQFFREHPALGRRDRGTIAETVFDVLRNRRLYAHLADSGTGRRERRLMLCSLAMRRGVGSLTDSTLDAGERDWLERILRIDVATLAAPVRYSLPDWLWSCLEGERGSGPAAALATALLGPAPLDLRVNLLKCEPAQAVEALRAEGIRAEPVEGVPTALRVEGKPALERTRAFEQGWVEVQDAGSQVLGALVGARRGQCVVDFCAGAGGKTLALAASMRSTGQVYACDVSTARLTRLRPRLARAGASNVQPFAIDRETDPKLTRLAARANAVLVDAPCSGTGTLRRNPDLKWRLEPGDIAELQSRQRAILAAAALLVKPGGVLVYGTCSLLSAENEAVVSSFETAHPGWEREPAASVLVRSGVTLGTGLDEDGCLRLSPDRDGTDGFFAARWRRT